MILNNYFHELKQLLLSRIRIFLILTAWAAQPLQTILIILLKKYDPSLQTKILNKRLHEPCYLVAEIIVVAIMILFII